MNRDKKKHAIESDTAESSKEKNHLDYADREAFFEVDVDVQEREEE